ncbi:MAG: hypothetical protein ACE37F_26840 [Nannocystaceae bacterium]|nr:hypothetical protein [bacterium]
MTAGDDDLDLGIGAVERNSGASGPGAADAAGSSDAVSGAAGVDSTGPVQATTAVDAPSSTAGVDEISAAIAAGSLSAADAQAMLIDQVVAAQLPEGADPALAAEIRAEVAAALAGDPVLASLLDPNG